IVLPIGISFFTFQAMSYVIDLYRGEYKVQKNPLKLALYISFFPQLIAGPIVKYRDINKELENRTISTDGLAEGFRRFIYGLGKKVISANTVAQAADQIFDISGASMTGLLAWTGAFLYTLQIYYDFSGYSDMAIGLGRMFGFNFLENFNYPYISRSITEFWRRWHISLASWFKDYVYIPLGGNRKGEKRQIVNMFIVFFLTGLWHGAFPNYILWGLYQWVFLMLEKHFLLKKLSHWKKGLRHVYTILITLPGMGLFYFEDLSAFGAYIGKLFGTGAFRGNEVVTGDILWYAGNYLPQLVIACVFAFPLVPWLKMKIASSGESTQRAIYAISAAAMVVFFLLSVASLVRDTYNPFLYFRF
ncbi:MAG: MBOAT family protein, partial [Lachnospiraceae bacterium]|nr:MBOAT family protein [Lachnospiraceae bacterium]